MKTMKAMQPKIVAVPYGGKIHTVRVSATNRGSAVEMAKQLLIEMGVLTNQDDIRLVSKVVDVKAPNIGETFGDNVDAAIVKARELVGC